MIAHFLSAVKTFCKIIVFLYLLYHLRHYILCIFNIVPYLGRYKTFCFVYPLPFPFYIPSHKYLFPYLTKNQLPPYCTQYCQPHQPPPMIPPKYLHKNKAPDTFKVIQCLIPLIQPAGNRIWAAANAARQHLPAIPLPYPSYSR